ncbi:DUF4153 domain-containing protein [Patulibacter defluvii]|uniref:DUF4153 domain-containing protein n=1 Tax=Patulibacter defluvii TaxID=3095358 RepID=UPI002A758B39|nr:DUF4173 domain-containing protein [Patulibacter sp. DM4]
MSRTALLCASIAAALAATAVAGQRVGLALTVVLLLTIAAGATAAPRAVDRPLLALAVALALQPTLRDAGWVVAVAVAGSLAATGAAVARPPRWSAIAPAVLAPLRLPAGQALVVRSALAGAPRVSARQGVAVVRGLAAAGALVVCFGGLFASADPAFADVADGLLRVDRDPADLLWRLALAAAVAGVAGALARAALGGPRAAAGPVAGGAADGEAQRGRTEALIAVAALVLLFVAYLAVQLQVLFGGDEYVRRTTGLGYGEYARQGFVRLLVVAVLTLAVVGVLARHRDRAVRALLGALCVLTLVVLASAELRLQLVQDAYGLSRVRYGGQAVLLWLAAVLLLVLAAGAHPAVARRAPRIALVATAAAVLVFAVSDPDRRIAESAVARAAAGGTVDVDYLSSLSADALPAVERLAPGRERGAVLWALRADLRRPDGVAGWNLARMRGR